MAVWLWGIKPGVRGFKFESADPNFTPLFVETTQGHPEVKAGVGTNSAQMEYVHRFYTLRDRVQSIGVARYRINCFTEWLGLHDWTDGTSMSLSGTETNTTMLWVGYRAKEQVLFRGAVLVAEDGQRLPLTPVVGNTFTARSEHLDQWTLPCLLTNRGTYRLILPGAGRTLLSFRYEPGRQAWW